MMGGMALSIERIRKPQSQGRKHHREAQPGRHAAERMDGLMLQRKVPCDEIGTHRHDDPPGQKGVEPNHENPRAVQCQGDQPGRPVDLEELLLQMMHGVSLTSEFTG